MFKHTDLNEAVVEVESDERGGHPSFSRDGVSDGSPYSAESIGAGLIVEGGSELSVAGAAHADNYNH